MTERRTQEWVDGVMKNPDDSPSVIGGAPMTSDRLGPLLFLTEDQQKDCARGLTNGGLDYARSMLAHALTEIRHQRAAVAERDDQIAALTVDRDSWRRVAERLEAEKVALAATVARVQALLDNYRDQVESVADGDHCVAVHSLARQVGAHLEALDAALKGDHQ